MIHVMIFTFIYSYIYSTPASLHSVSWRYLQSKVLAAWVVYLLIYYQVYQDASYEKKLYEEVDFTRTLLKAGTDKTD